MKAESRMFTSPSVTTQIPSRSTAWPWRPMIAFVSDLDTSAMPMLRPVAQRPSTV